MSCSSVSVSSLMCGALTLFVLFRPDLGTEVLPVISEALDPNTKSHVAVKCMAIQSLSLLVQAEVIDMKTIWEVLQDTLLSEDR